MVFAGVACWFAARFGWPDFHIAVGVLIVALSWLWSHEIGFVLGLVLVAGSAGSSARAAHVLVEEFTFSGMVRLIDEPVSGGFGSIKAIVAPVDGPHRGKRFEVRMFGEEISPFFGATAHSTLELTGDFRPIPVSDYSMASHVVGRGSVSEVQFISGPTGWRVVPEFVRRQIVNAAGSVSLKSRPLFLGLVIGEDSDQSVGERARFRDAGLSHLLAVSGQNVALVFAVLGGLFQRVPIGMRFPLSVAVLCCFAVITRVEPSVLRAVGVAGLSAWAAVTGASTGGIRILSLCVTGLVVIDPMLTRSVGFILSVVASAGIIVLSPVVFERTKNLRFEALRSAFAVALSAQVTVAPILIWFFGPVSLWSLPANVIAAPLAGFVMVYGSFVGVLSGLAPDNVVLIAAMPIEWGTTVLSEVASAFAGGSFRVGLIGWLFCASAVLCTLWADALRWRAKVAAFLFVAMAVGSTFAVERSHFGDFIHIAGDSSHPSVAVINDKLPKKAVERYLENGAPPIDVVVVADGTRANAEVVNAMVDVMAPKLVLAGPFHEVKNGTRVVQPTDIPTTEGVLRVAPAVAYLTVELVEVSG